MELTFPYQFNVCLVSAGAFKSTLFAGVKHQVKRLQKVLWLPCKIGNAPPKHSCIIKHFSQQLLVNMLISVGIFIVMVDTYVCCVCLTVCVCASSLLDSGGGWR